MLTSLLAALVMLGGGPSSSEPFFWGEGPKELTSQEDDQEGGAHLRSKRLQVRTNTAYTIEQGEVELDFVTSFLDFPHEQEWEVVAEVEVGLFDELLVKFGLPYLYVDEDKEKAHDGFGDPEFGLKWSPSLFRGDDITGALGVEISVPASGGKHGIGEEHAVWGVFGVLSAELDSVLTLHVHPFAEFQSDHKPELGVNTALDWRPGDASWSVLIGVNSVWEGSFHHTEVSLVPGFEVRLEERSIAYGFGVPIGITHEAQDWGLIFNLHFGF